MTRDDAIGPDLVRWGRAARLETKGRRTGHAVTAFISFHEERDGSLLVAAAHPDTSWALNLLADPSATVTIGERSYAIVAEPLAGADFAMAITELVLKGGTPAERLGNGPAFRLRRVAGSA